MQSEEVAAGEGEFGPAWVKAYSHLRLVDAIPMKAKATQHVGDGKWCGPHSLLSPRCLTSLGARRGCSWRGWVPPSLSCPAQWDLWGHGSHGLSPVDEGLGLGVGWGNTHTTVCLFEAPSTPPAYPYYSVLCFLTASYPFSWEQGHGFLSHERGWETTLLTLITGSPLKQVKCEWRQTDPTYFPSL